MVPTQGEVKVRQLKTWIWGLLLASGWGEVGQVAGGRKAGTGWREGRQRKGEWSEGGGEGVDRYLLPSKEIGTGRARPGSGVEVKGRGRPPRPALLGEESRCRATPVLSPLEIEKLPAESFTPQCFSQLQLIQLTLEQYRLELSGSTYMQIYFQ